MKIGLREANQRFSRVVRAVRAGRAVVLTERGRPMAVIKRLQRADSHEAALEAMADEGLIAPASRKGPVPPPRWRPVTLKGKPLSRTIIDDREERA